jgi:threonine/homoserine/homoserine lactone efflux protein
VIASLVALFVIGILALVASVVAIALLGALLSVVLTAVGFLLFKVAPVLLLVWLAVRLLQDRRPSGGISSSDTAWLDR